MNLIAEKIDFIAKKIERNRYYYVELSELDTMRESH
jgi:hypothetical protein